jgi:hypothetical protein
MRFIGTVQRKLTWVKSGIKRQLMMCQSVAWYFYFILKSFEPLNVKNTFQQLNKLLECRVW